MNVPLEKLPPQSFQISDPAAGAEFTYTVPAGTLYVFWGLSCTFVTSATAASRQLALKIDDGTTVLYRSFNTNAITASLTRFIYFLPGQLQGVAAAGSYHYVPFPGFALLKPGWRIISETISIQAGDQYSAIWVNVQKYEFTSDRDYVR